MAPWVAAVLSMSVPVMVSADDAPAMPPAEAAKPAAIKSAEGDGYVVDFLDYRLEIQTRIENIWTDYLTKYGSQLKRGREVFSYHVNPDGKVTLVKVDRKGPESDLAVLAHRSIIEANKKMVPFPASVKEKHPSGYFNQIAFAVK